MVKKELAKKVAIINDIPEQKALKIIDTIINEISENVAAGGSVSLRGLFTIKTKFRAARVGRNIKTGESYPIEARHTPVCVFSQSLRDRVAKISK